MKPVKLIIALFVTTVVIFSCKDKNSDSGDQPTSTVEKPSVKKEEVGFEKLSKLLTKDIAFKIFDSAGKTEADPAARGQRKVKNNAVVSVWLNDLVLTMSGGDITYTVSPNAKWGGCQRFGPGMSMDGAYAIWSCERYWYAPGLATTVTCTEVVPAGESNYRAFTADHDYQIHISNVVQINN